MAAGLFDILKDIFAGQNLSHKYTDQELKNCGFSINRIMSIKYPVQAQSQNVLGVNYLGVVKYWAVNMKGKFTRLPQWAYIATAKERKAWMAKMGEVEMPDKETLTAFKEFHGLDSHEFQFLVQSKPKEISAMMKEFEENYRI